MTDIDMTVVYRDVDVFGAGVVSLPPEVAKQVTKENAHKIVVLLQILAEYYGLPLDNNILRGAITAFAHADRIAGASRIVGF